MNDINRIIQEVNSTMAMEDQKRIGTYLANPALLDQMIYELVQKYSVKPVLKVVN